MKDLGQFSHESGHTDLTGVVSCPGYAYFVDKHETGIIAQFGWFVLWVDCEKIQLAGRKYWFFLYILILNFWNGVNTYFTTVLV